MESANFEYWYAGWGWFLWLVLVMVIFSSFGNWGYTYRVHRRFKSKSPEKSARDILNERYASGELEYSEYEKMKARIYNNEKYEKSYGDVILNTK